MGTPSLSSRTFLIDDQDRIFRLAVWKHIAMASTPELHPLPQFAGKRVRFAIMTVELVGRRPSVIYSVVYLILKFDEHGVQDNSYVQRRLVSIADLNPESVEPTQPEAVEVVHPEEPFDTTGWWKPTRDLKARICDAALGKLRCRRV